MFNHARTVLINVTGSNNPGYLYLGEELVPENYEAVVLPSFLENIRVPLFGAAPDRAFLNYRTRQFLTLIAGTELQQYITDLDSRITYTLNKDNVYARHETWDPVISRYGGTEDDIATVSGSPARPDFTGKMFYQFDVNVLSSTSIKINRQTPPSKSQNLDLSLTAGLSPAYDLFYTGHTLYVNTTNSGAAWTITGYLRPQIYMSEIAEQLESAGDDTLTELFGTKRVEPWNTFRNIWYDHPELPYRLSAIVLALVYRTDEVRVNVNG